ncbi:hypothetical protein KST23_01430 [Fusobacterium nucleatum]
MKRIKFVHIYFLFLLYFIGGYFFNIPFIDKGIYSKIYNYLGILLFPTLLFFILYGFVFLIVDKKLRLFWELRLNYIFIFFILGLYLYILFTCDVRFFNIRTFKINDEFLKTLISKCLFEYNIGYLPSYILYELINISLKFNQYPFYYFYYFIVGIEIFLIILTIFTPTSKSIKRANLKRKREKERARMEAELLEQIKIKEKLQRIEELKIQKHKKIEEAVIREKIDNFEKMKKNKKTSRKKSNEHPSDEQLQSLMENISLQKTVTIKED